MTAADSPPPPSPSLSTTTTVGAMTTNDTSHEKKGDIVLSNPSVSISQKDNFDVYPHFLTDATTVNLLRDLGLLNAVTNGDIGVIGKEFAWEGFDQRRRVQRFRLPPPSPSSPSTSSSSSGEKPNNEEISDNDNGNGDDESKVLPPALLELWNRIHHQQQKRTQEKQHEENDPTATSNEDEGAVSSSESSLPFSLQQQQQHETEIAVEVYPQSQLIHLGRSSRTQVMTFETSCSRWSDTDTDTDDTSATATATPDTQNTANHDNNQNDDDNHNFVAILPLNMSLIENSNRPEKREVNCWHLKDPKEQNSTSVLLPKQTLIVKRHGEYLYEWRSRIASVATQERVADWACMRKNNSNDSDNHDDNNNSSYERSIIQESISNNANTKNSSLVVLIKIYHLPKDLMPSSSSSSDANRSNSTNDMIESPEFGYVRTPEHEQRDLQRQEMSQDEVPPLEELLTIIVTTSPIRSHPSTELLEKVFGTFTMCGPEFAYKCRKLIICDGCRQRDANVSKRHTNDKQSMRNGIVNNEQYINYVEFRKNLHRLCTEALPDTTFCRTDIEEIEERQGYGFALRHGLRHCNITTPYVIVIQHDRTFMRPTPMKEIVRTMWNRSNIKYVGMSMRSNLLYRDIFISQYGKSYMDEMAQCSLRPPELALDSKLYGPNSESTRLMNYGMANNGNNPKLRQSIIALADSYQGSQQQADHLAWMKANGQDPDLPSETNQLSLTPTFFWYDNVHICETAHYRDFVYNPKYKMVVKGGFVEDKLSPAIKKTVERLGLREGHTRFGCFLLDDHSGMFFTGHLDGGSYLTKEGKEIWRANKIKEEMANKQK